MVTLGRWLNCEFAVCVVECEQGERRLRDLSGRQARGRDKCSLGCALGGSRRKGRAFSRGDEFEQFAVVSDFL